VPKHTTFPQRKLKITKCEQRTIETSINNSFVRERGFYYLNERFMCQIREISFSRQGRNASNNKHLTSDLPMHAKDEMLVALAAISSHGMAFKILCLC